MASPETPSSAGQTLNITLDTSTERGLSEYLPLYKAILQGNLEAAKEILDNDPDALKAGINSSKQTALHIAVATLKPYHFIEKLVELMPDESIALRDVGGNTALSIAATVGNKEAAVLLVNKMNSLLYVADIFGNFPVHHAAQCANKGMLEYLITQTKEDLEINPYADERGLRLLIYVIDAKFFEVAINLVQKYPHVATLKLPDGTSALKKIAAKRSLFLIANNIVLKHILLSRHIFKDRFLLIEQAIELVKCLCKIMGSKGHKEAADIYGDAILTATELGSHEIVEQILEAFPDAIYCSTPSNQSILHIAILNRSIDVFRFIYPKKSSDNKRLPLDMVDSDGNNLLHTAAKLAPSHKLNEDPGAAFQMMREIRWFWGMESLINPNCRHQLNKAGKTPKMVFVEEHQKLKEEALNSTKDMTASSMVVAALIAGVAFAGSITVPGGNENNSGLPIFIQKKAFKYYVSSNIGSFWTATLCLSILLVMSIMRFANEDSALAIPEAQVFSVFILFMSVGMMISSFFAAATLVAGKMTRVPYEATFLLAWMPLLLFLWVLLPSLFRYLIHMFCSINLVIMKMRRHL